MPITEERQRPEVVQLELTLSPTIAMVQQSDGSVLIKQEKLDGWVSTEKACRMLRRMDRKSLYALGKRGVIVGRQPNKPIDQIRMNVKTKHHWEWSVQSIYAYLKEADAAVEEARDAAFFG